MDSLSRRRFLTRMTGTGVAASALLVPEVVAAELGRAGAQQPTPEMILDAARIAGLELSREQAEAIVDDVAGFMKRERELHETRLGNAIPLPLPFDPRVPGVVVDRTARPIRASRPEVERPKDLEMVAFWPLTHLARLVETRQVTATELTEMYLGRLKRYGPELNCVVTLTTRRALDEAARADEEIAAGRYRGPLHGIPYGVKDIIAAAGYPTTWGAPPFEDRVFDEDATVVRRLGEARAVLVAKLATGELAFGDQWFRGRTNNPWDLNEGSSGSSAGPGAATSAGLVGFSIGTDTGGSILSPSERCGVVGLRPTFGRVSRHGVMAAGTTLDKVGPMCRGAEDAALVLHAIAGPDGLDFSVPDGVPVHWDAELDVSGLRVGYHASAFEAEPEPEYRKHHDRVARLVRSLAGELTPVHLPETNLNFFIEYTERAAAFDELRRAGLDAKLGQHGRGDQLRTYHLVSAVEYLQANRKRQLIMEDTHRSIEGVDVVLSPRTHWDPKRSLNPLTSLTGHPVVAVPTGLASDGTPMGVTLTGRLYHEGEVLALAGRLLEATGFERNQPPRFSVGRTLP